MGIETLCAFGRAGLWVLTVVFSSTLANGADVSQTSFSLFPARTASGRASNIASQHSQAFALQRRSDFGSETFGRLFARQQLVCPDPNGPSCSATRCCPSTQTCCGTTGCCGLKDRCQSTLGQCCPSEAETCGDTMCKEPGAVCCGTFACAPGYVCNVAAQACCKPGEIKCSAGCCPSGSTCASTPGYCSRISLSTSTSTSTSTITSKSTSTSTSTTSFTSISISISYTTTTRSACSTSGAVKRQLPPTPVVEDPSLEKRQTQRYPFPTECVKVCHEASNQQMPLMEIKNVPGQTDKLIESMCAGMDGWYKRQKAGIGVQGQSRIDTDASRGEDVLTYDGPASTNPRARQRRKGVCSRDSKTGKGWCAAESERQGIELQCDEYPPAMVVEGGGLATQVCIPKEQNSGTQAPIFSEFRRVCGLKAGDKFIVRLEGGCSRFNFPARRNAASSVNSLHRRAKSENLSGGNSTLRDPNGDGSLSYVATDLGDLRAGHYDLTLDLLGTNVVRAEVLNRYGDSYALLENPNSSARVSFDVSDNLTSPGVLVAYTDRGFSLSYKGSVKLSSPGSRVRLPILWVWITALLPAVICLISL